ncbi:MAG: T9SS type A sorting domain-containing protein [Lentimicrobiaceae bacterium]|nr:T9SS type A sorting domain-containing protein [Lentimicrobiaceae bacterium]
MKVVKGILLGMALTASATGFSQGIVKQRLDSLVQEVGTKCIWFYDDYGNDTLLLGYRNNQISYKYEQAYDAAGNMTKFAYYKWDIVNNSWEGNEKYEYAYDSAGNITMQVIYVWNSTTNDWIERLLGRIKYEYTYDTNGNRTMQTIYVWNNTTNDWRNSRKYEYTYDTNGNQTMEINHVWDNSTNGWKENSKSEYSYDTNGNKTMEINLVYLTITNDWGIQSKYEYAYDVNGNLTTEIWWASNYYKYEYAYDNMNNRITRVHYNLNNVDWVEYSKMEYEHNLSYNFDDLILSNWGHTYYNQIAAKNMFVGEKTYSRNGEEWDLTLTETWYYSEQKVLDIVEANRGNIKVYPNPTTGKLSVESDKVHKVESVEIYDVVGQVVGAYRIRPENTETVIDISHLAKGMYFLKIDGKMVKVVKQ